MVRPLRPVRSAAVALIGTVLLAGTVAPAARAEDPPPVPAEQPAGEPAPTSPEPTGATADGTETVSAVVETEDGLEVLSVEAAPAAVDEAIADLAATPGVVSVGVDSPAYVTAVPDDPYRPDQWGFDQLDLDLLPPGTPDASGVLVAVLDTGVLATHPDLAGRVRCDLGTSFTDDEATYDPDDDGCVDPNGHGTHVAGTVGAISDNGVGVTGVSAAQILPVRVLDAEGGGRASHISAGIRHAVDNGASVINMSLGGQRADGADVFFSEAVQYALDHDVVVVASAGNDRYDGNRPGFPAALPGVVAVAATDDTGTSAFFSTTGPYVLVSAPGEGILSTTNDGSYGWLSGTSMAAPHAAGVIARYRAAHPAATAAEVRAAVRDTAIDLETPGRDHATGYGLIDAHELLTGEEDPVPPGSGRPGAPTVTSVVPTSGGATVRWEPSAFDAGLARDGSYVEYSDTPQNPYSFSGVWVAGGGANEAVLSGLVDGRTYTVRVTTLASDWFSDQSQAVEFVPGTAAPSLPAAPALGTPTSADGTLTVPWTPAPGTDLTALTGWTLRAYQGGSLVASIRVPKGDRRASMTGLTNGTAYTLTVQARNITGEGPESAPTAAAAPRTAPGTVAAPTATPGERQATVQWNAPAVDGGSPITGYTVTAYRQGAQVTHSVGAAARSLTVSGLTAGQPHTFTVAARNAAGSYPGYRHSTAVVPSGATAPGAPGIGAATPAEGSATVRWSAPATDGGSPVTGYTVRAWQGGSPVQAVTVPAAARSATVTGLVNGTAYSFTVTAANALGAGPASAASATVVPRTTPGAPVLAKPTAGKGSVRITWTAPGVTGGAPVTGYVVKVWKGSALVKTVDVAASARSAVVTRLRGGVAYTVTVTARNDAGLGTQSAKSRSVTPLR